MRKDERLNAFRPQPRRRSFTEVLGLDVTTTLSNDLYGLILGGPAPSSSWGSSPRRLAA
jgi:hypothetical protein